MRHVSPNGSDCATCGTAAAPYKTIRYAVKQLRPGDTLSVHQGTYYESPFTLSELNPAHGTATAPIRVQRALNEARPILRPAAGGRTFMDVDRRYWIFDGLEFVGGDSADLMLYFRSDHIALLNSVIRGSRMDAVVVHGASHVLVQGNLIHDTWEAPDAAGETDGHAVRISSYSHSVTLRDNLFRDNSGDGLQCHGPSEVPGARPFDILLEGNVMYTTPANYGRVENAVDVKDCDRVTLRREKYYSFRSELQNGQLTGGHVIVLHIGAAEILVEDSEVFDTCGGVGVGGTSSDPVHSIVIRRTRFREMKRSDTGCAGDSNAGNAVHLQKVTGARLSHNTFSGVAGGALVLGIYAVSDVSFWNNIVSTRHASSAWMIVNTTPSDVRSDYNLFWHANAAGSRRLFCGAGGLTLQEWQAGCTRLVTRDFSSTEARPLFTNESSGDLTLQGTSPAIDTALHDGTSRFCGYGPDRGAVERCVAPGPQLTLKSPLVITGTVLGQPTTAEYVVVNSGTVAVTVQYFLGGARGPAGENVDFPATAPITIPAGGEYPVGEQQQLF